jgi:hypothetical protein
LRSPELEREVMLGVLPYHVYEVHRD